MLGEALLDLSRLLVGVDVQRQLVLVGVPSELLEPLAGTRTDRVGGDADANPVRPQLVELAQIRGHGLLPKTIDPAARVGDVEEDELDSRLGGRLRHRASLLEPEVVKLADGGVARSAQLAVDVDVLPPDTLRRLSCR